MSYFKIILPELAEISQELLSPSEEHPLTKDFNYRTLFRTIGKCHFRISASLRLGKESDQVEGSKPLKSASERTVNTSRFSSARIVEASRLPLTGVVEGSRSVLGQTVEGFGQIDILQGEKTLTYIGEWLNGHLKIYHFKSPIFQFTAGLFLLRGVEYKLDFFQTEELRTHLPFKVQAIASLERHQLFAPIVHEAQFYLEVPQEPIPKIFYLEIDDSKPDQQFLINSDLALNSITEKIIAWEQQLIIDLRIVIKKETVAFIKTIREGSQEQSYREEKLLISTAYNSNPALAFFEKRYRAPIVSAQA